MPLVHNKLEEELEKLSVQELDGRITESQVYIHRCNRGIPYCLFVRILHYSYNRNVFNVCSEEVFFVVFCSGCYCSAVCELPS